MQISVRLFEVGWLLNIYGVIHSPDYDAPSGHHAQLMDRLKEMYMIGSVVLRH